MSKAVRRAVFDCNTFLQALSSTHGPAGRCVQLAIAGEVDLYISPALLQELREVTGRPKVILKLRLVEERVQEFFDSIEIAATLLEGFPEPFVYRRDADDEHYVNLALAARARLIVSRDKDLLDLMDLTKPEAAEFQKQFPFLRILNPLEFLNELTV